MTHEQPQRFAPSWQVLARESWVLVFVVVAVELVRDVLGTDRLVVASLLPIALLGGLCAAAGMIVLSVHLSSIGIHEPADGIVRWSDIVRAERDGQVIRYESAPAGGGRPILHTLRLNPGVRDALHRWTDEAHPIRRALLGAPARRRLSEGTATS